MTLKFPSDDLNFSFESSPTKIKRALDKEENQFLPTNPNHEAAQKELEIKSLSQDIEERKTFAKRAFGITIVWVVFLLVLTFLQFFLRNDGLGLTEIEFNIVFSTTTASVFGFWF
jgi:hypothetical protein